MLIGKVDVIRVTDVSMSLSVIDMSSIGTVANARALVYVPQYFASVRSYVLLIALLFGYWLALLIELLNLGSVV